jgi:pyruvate dehydrogenase complex dehydrogenase (E1) component
MTNRTQSIPPDELRMLGELERKVLWLASWTIHYVNHLRESADGLKVGGQNTPKRRKGITRVARRSWPMAC